MRRSPAPSSVVVLLGVGVLAWVGGATMAAEPAPSPAPSAAFLAGRALADLGSRTFAESMVAGPDRDAWVAVTHVAAKELQPAIAQVEHVTRFGERTPVGPLFPTGAMHGLARDEAGNIYAALASLGSIYGPIAPDSSVVRIAPDGTWETILQLGQMEHPNGLAWHDGALYVTDSWFGRVLRIPAGDPVIGDAEVWLSDPALAGTSEFPVGVNGIVFVEGAVILSVTFASMIVAVPLLPDGSPGELDILAKDDRLFTADGLTVGPDGSIWVAVNHGRVLRLLPDRTLQPVPLDMASLGFPTQPLFVADGTRLWVLNGEGASGLSRDATIAEFDVSSLAPAG